MFSFVDSHGPITGCSEAKLNEGSPDTATCATTLEGPGGIDEITATYSGDSNYAGSSGKITENVEEAPAIGSEGSATFTEGHEGSFKVTASGIPAPSVSESGTLPNGVEFDPFSDELSGVPTQEGAFPIVFEASNGVGGVAVQHFTLTVDAPAQITSAAEVTFNDREASKFTVTATGTPAPTITKWGNLPAGVTFSEGVLFGTPTETGTFEITFTAANDVGADSTQQFTLTVVGLHVTTASLPEAMPGRPYSQQLEASGGVTPLKWHARGLPHGLKLSSTGLLSGEVSARKYPHGGSALVTVTVSDSSKHSRQHATATFTLTLTTA